MDGSTSAYTPALAALIEASDLVSADVRAWWNWRHKEEAPVAEAFERIYARLPEFRSLMHYRFRSLGLDLKALPRMAVANDLYIICDDIGPGFRIQHGYSTWIAAESIGRDFFINQNVTIGLKGGKKPVIGNNVRVCTGAVVFGGITVGDNVVIAPNAVVDFDVPAGKKVFPARSVIV